MSNEISRTQHELDTISFMPPVTFCAAKLRPGQHPSRCDIVGRRSNALQDSIPKSRNCAAIVVFETGRLFASIWGSRRKKSDFLSKPVERSQTVSVPAVLAEIHDCQRLVELNMSEGAFVDAPLRRVVARASNKGTPPETMPQQPAESSNSTQPEHSAQSDIPGGAVRVAIDLTLRCPSTPSHDAERLKTSTRRGDSDGWTKY